MSNRWSLRTRFLVAAALCLLPLVGVVSILFSLSLNQTRDQIVDTDYMLTDVVSQGITATLEENQIVLTDLSKDPRITGMSPDAAQEALTAVRNARPSLNGLFLLDQNSQVVASAGGIDPTEVLAQIRTASDKALSTGEPAVSNPVTLSDGSVVVIALFQPVIPEEGDANGQINPAGAVGAFLNVERLQRSFLPPAGYASPGRSILVAGDQTVVVTSTTVDAAIALQGNADLKAPIEQALAGNRAQASITDGEGNELLAVVAPVAHPDVTWAVIITTRAPTTFGFGTPFLNPGILGFIGALVIAMILAGVFADRLARPLRQLTRQATAIASDNSDERIEIVGSGEVAALSEAFRTMADRLTTQIRDTVSTREEVAQQAERLRELLRRTVRLQEDERRRIASDIHDAVSPLITGALYQTRAIKLAGNGHDPADEEGLTTVAELLERSMSELHDVIFALRPPDLDDLGVVAAIERYVGQIDRTGLPCKLEVVGEQHRLSPEARLSIYRIVQEALHNALRHADADDAVVRMEWLDDRLRMTVRDNGSGFDPEQAANPSSLGLLSMRERAAAIGATLEVASRPGAGTVIMLERPWSSDPVAESRMTDQFESDIAPRNGDHEVVVADSEVEST